MDGIQKTLELRRVKKELMEQAERSYGRLMGNIEQFVDKKQNISIRELQSALDGMDGGEGVHLLTELLKLVTPGDLAKLKTVVNQLEQMFYITKQQLDSKQKEVDNQSTLSQNQIRDAAAREDSLRKWESDRRAELAAAEKSLADLRASLQEQRDAVEARKDATEKECEVLVDEALKKQRQALAFEREHNEALERRKRALDEDQIKLNQERERIRVEARNMHAPLKEKERALADMETRLKKDRVAIDDYLEREGKQIRASAEADSKRVREESAREIEMRLGKARSDAEKVREEAELEAARVRETAKSQAETESSAFQKLLQSRRKRVWKECLLFPRSSSADTRWRPLRLLVMGPYKTGKSTFLKSITAGFGGEYLSEAAKYSKTERAETVRFAFSRVDDDGRTIHLDGVELVDIPGDRKLAEHFYNAYFEHQKELDGVICVLDCGDFGGDKGWDPAVFARNVVQDPDGVGARIEQRMKANADEWSSLGTLVTVQLRRKSLLGAMLYYNKEDILDIVGEAQLQKSTKHPKKELLDWYYGQIAEGLRQAAGEDGIFMERTGSALSNGPERAAFHAFVKTLGSKWDHRSFGPDCKRDYLAEWRAWAGTAADASSALGKVAQGASP